MDHPSIIDDLLRRLDAAIRIEGGPPIELLICGGAALIRLGYIDRATEDVDVLALIIDGVDASAEPFPGVLTRAAERVARDVGMPSDWINPGPASARDLGLPPGIVERSQAVRYGESLTAHFVERQDQVFLKLDALLDRGGKHTADFLALNPTEDEVVAAARWCLSLEADPSGRRLELMGALPALGYENAAVRIP